MIYGKSKMLSRNWYMCVGNRINLCYVTIKSFDSQSNPPGYESNPKGDFRVKSSHEYNKHMRVPIIKFQKHFSMYKQETGIE
ncbi:hypothetical protein Ahy_A04g017637 isoform E [Arachis hypogaea]|uniref:Uncharacterized protein n=1 Tax=Arachis hypogaea TaxID=3818 RepID=A0A445DBN8_ARAHY|nr:hypothetical protein Ahy_A04g017637 isoform E [Arachis hypogaea]